MIKAIGFDLGDTLIYYNGIPLNWRDHYHNALIAGFNKTGIVCTRKQLVECSNILNTYNTRIFPREIEVTSEQIFNRIKLITNINIDQEQVVIHEFYKYFQQKSYCFPETIKILHEISKYKIPIGILTDVPYGMPKSYVLKDIKNIQKYINTILTSIDIGYRKPTINGYLKLAEQLNVNISEMLYVGNEEKDILGANKAGAYSVLINRTNHKINYLEKEQFNSLETMWYKIKALVKNQEN